MEQVKIIKWGIEITDECPDIAINQKLANYQGKLTITEQFCVAILNHVNDSGYTYISNEQLAHWLHLDKPNSPRGVATILRRLSKNGFIKRGQHKLIVCRKYRNTPEERTQFEEWGREPLIL